MRSALSARLRPRSSRSLSLRAGVCVLAVASAVVLSSCSSSPSAPAGSVSSAGGSSAATAAGGSAAPLTVGFVAVSGQQAPLAWAAEEGYFKKAGLDVQVQVTRTGTTAALVSGRIDLVLGSPGNLFGTVNDGIPVKFVFQNDSSPFVAVAADPKVTSITQCRSMATGAPGTNARAGTSLSQRVFKANWAIVQLTDPSAFGPTVISGRAECGIGPNILYLSSVLQGKLHVIFNSSVKSDLPAGWPGGTMQTIGGMAKDVSAKGPAIAKFLKVYLAAIKDYMTTPSASEAATLIAGKNGWEGLTPAVLTAEISTQKSALAPDNGYLTPAAWQAMLSFQAKGGLSIVNPADPKWAYTSLVDMAYYDQGIGQPAGN